MPHIVTAESDYGKELIKFEQHETKRITGDWTPGNPYKFRPYPKMLYRATKRHDGSVVCMDGMPHPLAFPTAEAHDRACQVGARVDQRAVEVERDVRVPERDRACHERWVRP